MLFMLIIYSDWSVCTDGMLLAYPHTRELGVFAVGGLNEFGSPRVFWLANDFSLYSMQHVVGCFT